MEDAGRSAHRLTQCVGVSDIGYFYIHLVAVSVPQPAQILLDAGPCQVVVYEDSVSLREQPVRDVGADEPGSAGDQDGTSGNALHTVSPRDASSALASATRSVAT
jgi:hypothetical protein